MKSPLLAIIRSGPARGLLAMHASLVALLLLAPPQPACCSNTPRCVCPDDLPRWVASPHLLRRHRPIYGNYYRSDFDYRAMNDYPWFLWPHVPRGPFVIGDAPFSLAPDEWPADAELIPPGAAWPAEGMPDPRIKPIHIPSPPPLAPPR